MENNYGTSEKSWYEDENLEDEDSSIKEYDITASPNDFNNSTMYSFIDSGSLKIPGFQRHYVWDIKRASKLIESIIIGLPIPQVFLYEEDRNSFLVIDGQQRLMSLYYFIKQRFPKKEKRVELRNILSDHGVIPDEILGDDKYFSKFNLQLGETQPGVPNRLNKLNYSTLGDYKTTFDLRTIRNVIIKQNSPTDDDSSIYEIFNRLNSGGINLKPQEIRSSMYHSNFYELISKLNMLPKWRELINQPQPDLHMKDFEIILRGFAMVVEGESYTPSISRFLNRFSKHSKSISNDKINYLNDLFEAFLGACSELQPKSFYGAETGRFNISFYEAVFRALCHKPFKEQTLDVPTVSQDKIELLKRDPEFVAATHSRTADTVNVKKRYERAKSILL